MYAFEPTEEQKMLVETLSRFASTGLRAKAHEADETTELPPSLMEKGWELGYLQASIPETYGGFGERSVVTGALAAEELAWGDLAGALAVMAPGLYVTPLLLAGSEQQKLEHIPPVIEAEWRPYTAALLEPFFNFDPNELHITLALEEDGEYILRGEKSFVPYAAEAEGMIVYASLEGVTQGFIVPRDTPGLEDPFFHRSIPYSVPRLTG